MYRLWIGVSEETLERGAIYPTLDEALARGYQFAIDYAVRIEIGSNEWHTFAESQSTILGPDFDVGDADEAIETEVDEPGPPAIDFPELASAIAPPGLVEVEPVGEQPDDIKPSTGELPVNVEPVEVEPVKAEPIPELPASDEPIDEQPAVIELEAEAGDALDSVPTAEVPRPPPLRNRNAPLTLEYGLDGSAEPAPSTRRSKPTTERRPTTVRRKERVTLPEPPAKIASGTARKAERRKKPRQPFTLADHTATWEQRPVRLLDVSWTGARIASRPTPRAGKVVVIEVRTKGLVAHLAGQVRWVGDGQCGIAFDESLMSRHSTQLLERLLGQKN